MSGPFDPPVMMYGVDYTPGPVQPEPAGPPITPDDIREWSRSLSGDSPEERLRAVYDSLIDSLTETIPQLDGEIKDKAIGMIRSAMERRDEVIMSRIGMKR